jgi:hypothetical protein
VKGAEFYIKWAEWEASSSQPDRAEKILKAAIASKVQPTLQLELALDRLEKGILIPFATDLGEEVANSTKTASEMRKTNESIRRPLQEKTLPETPIRTTGNDHSKTTPQIPEDNTTTFKARLARGRGRLGPPSRQPRSEALASVVEESEPKKSFPSPESLNSCSPHSSKENSPAPPRPLQSTTAVADDSYASSSSSEDDTFDKENGLEQTQIMDLSQTITIIHQTPRQKNEVTHIPSNEKTMKIISSRERVKSEEDVPDKNQIQVNGKTYFRSGVIGKGGSCKVFKIVDHSGQIFALKKVKLRGQDASVVEGYKNEIILLNKLKNNDRIIRLFDAQHDPQQQILLMVLEYGEIDLEKMLQKDAEQPLSINFIRNYWEQMLQAVQAIHDQNIIHSDLKPAVPDFNL